ncbi:uncharacterized protein LOC106050770 isoform X3 [Biomphalaria glabrata]|nr:uncharacterized protein LOC106050770 isoform X3 [Biomphalaria glabrata]
MTSSAPAFWGGKDGLRSKKADEWSNTFVSTLGLIDRDLSLLYDGVKTDEDVPALGLAKDDQEANELSLHEVCDKFVAHCEKAVDMLSEPTNGTVRLSLGKLLAVVRRCLQVTHNDVHSIPSMITLSELLPTVHISMLSLISQLILCCRTVLMPKSRLIIDLCLNALTSMTNLKEPLKSQTRSSIYNVLTLLIETLGWSGHLTSQLKTLTQELISDIKLQREIQKQPLTQDKQDVLGRKKKKGKKINKAESYSELTVINEASAEDKGNKCVSPTGATLAALKLSRQALQNVEFIFVENIMHCILETGKLLQREEPPQSSPYFGVACRKELYSCIFSCALVFLGPGCSRKKVITHFQMSNTSINLLRDGMFEDVSFEVQKTCKDVLTLWKLTSHLNRPIVRRILPDDCTEKEDILEVEREKQQLSEENEQLRQRLVSMEMESKQQSRLVASLQQELKDIKRKRADELFELKETNRVCDEEQEDDDCDTLNHADLSQSPVTTHKTEVTVDSQLCAVEENMEIELQKESPSPVAQDKRDSSEVPNLEETKTPLKRKREKPKQEQESKKTKKQQDTNNITPQSDNESLQAMISDFIDAEPDIL